MKIKLKKIDRNVYEKYGSLIAAADDHPHRLANMNTAKRYNNLCDLKNLRGEKAQLNICVFQCQSHVQLPLKIELLERHPYSTQVFLPATSNARFLAIVCLGEDSPNLDTLQAFICEGNFGITYHPNIWHYPIMCLDKPITFNCLIYEDGSKNDCEINKLDIPILVEV